MQEVVKNLSTSNFNKKKYHFLYPLFLFVILLLFDRFLSSDLVRFYTENRAEYYFYNSRELLIEANFLESKENQDKSTVVILGTSHLGELDVEKFQKLRPDLLPYNYSAPLPSFSYFNFILRKIINKEIQIKYLILEISPLSADLNSNYYALRYSYDLAFLIFQNKFSLSEIDIIFRRIIFHTQIYPFRFKEILKRIKNPVEGEYFNLLKNNILNNFKEKRGGISNELLYNTSEERLKEDIEIYYKNVLLPCKISPEQLYFFEDLLKIAKDNNIKIILVEAVVHPELYEKMKISPFFRDWSTYINNLIKNNNLNFISLQNELKNSRCLNFLDPNHLSGKCYSEPTELIIQNLR